MKWLTSVIAQFDKNCIIRDVNSSK
jgi:hypothetical protein